MAEKSDTLSYQEAGKITLWLNANHNLVDGKTASEVSTLIVENFGKKVTNKSIRSLCEGANVLLKDTSKSKPMCVVHDRLNLLAAEMRRLYVLLGEEPSADFLAVFRGEGSEK